MDALAAPALELLPAGPVRARLRAPGSKSVTNRALLCAALAEGTSVLRDPLDSDDSQAMRAALIALGATVETDVDPGAPAAGLEGAATATGSADRVTVWRVTGTGGKLAVPAAPLDARASGTTMRFLTAAATLAPARVTVTGRPGLLARPIGPLVTALRALGAAVSDQRGYPPVTVLGGGLDGGAVALDAAASSQFASAVLLAAPYARRPVELRVRGLGAPAYVALTAQVMRDFGAAVEQAHRGSPPAHGPVDSASSPLPARGSVVTGGPPRARGAAGVSGRAGVPERAGVPGPVPPGAGEVVWRVEARRPYQARQVTVEYDASAAAHLLALAAATGGEVTVVNAADGSWQPDARFPEVLAAMGCTVRRDGAALTVRGPARLDPLDVDLAAMPDQVTTVAVLAALAGGRSRLRGVAVARGHESDRLAALAGELGKLAVRVRELPDGLVIDGGAPRGPARIDPHDDHRLAMAFAALAARVPGVAIAQPGCVAKTYPSFWDDLGRAGLAWTVTPGRGRA